MLRTISDRHTICEYRMVSINVKVRGWLALHLHEKGGLKLAIGCYPMGPHLYGLGEHCYPWTLQLTPRL